MVYLRLPFGHDIIKSWEVNRHFVWRQFVVVLYKLCLYKLKVQPVNKKL